MANGILVHGLDFDDTHLGSIIHPTCTALPAALALGEALDASGAELLTAFLPQPTLHIIAEPAEAKERPGTDYEAKFSAKFVTAYCLLRGRFGLPELAPAALADTEVLDLSRRVTCLADPDSAFPTYFSGGVEVTLADGHKLFRHTRVNSGAGERATDEAAASEKFHASASLAFAHDKADRVREAVLALDTVSVRELGMLLRG